MFVDYGLEGLLVGADIAMFQDRVRYWTEFIVRYRAGLHTGLEVYVSWFLKVIKTGEHCHIGIRLIMKRLWQEDWVTQVGSCLILFWLTGEIMAS